MNGSASLRTRTEEDLKRPIATFADGSTQPSVPVLAPVVDVETAAPASKKKLLMVEERREAREEATAGGHAENDGAGPFRAGPPVSVTGRYVLIMATSCQAERNVSVLTHLFGYLRSNVIVSKEENIMFIRLTSHLMDEVRELDAAVEQARARAV